MPVLNSLNLSNNLLSGEIPLEIDNLKLSFLNVSGNHLYGSVPVGYNNLAYRHRVLISVIVVAIIVCLIGIGFLHKRHKISVQVNTSTESCTLTSFHMVDFEVSDILNGLIEYHVIGSAHAGKVYKVALENGNIVDVKRIWNNENPRSVQEKRFRTEIDLLGKLRHTDVVKLLCCISGSDSKLSGKKLIVVDR